MNPSMDINRAAPVTASGEALIDADPETVFSVISAIEAWPSWNPDVKSAELEGPVEPDTVFRWKAGLSSLTSTLQVVEQPHESHGPAARWASRRFTCSASSRASGGTLARSEESWEGLIASVLKGWSRRTLEKGIDDVLAHLKVESERRAGGASAWR